jgi:hypothetical protein
MFIRSLVMGLLLESAVEPTGGGAGAPPAPAPAPGQPFAVFHNQAEFDARIERAQRSALREQFGTESADEVKARLARLKELETAEEERKRAELTETQKLQADLAAERERVTRLERERAAAEWRVQVTSACVSTGIKNVKYALFEADEARSRVPAGQAFDVEAHLKSLLEKPEMKGAFGVASEPITTVPAPVTTSPNPDGEPPPPPRGNPAPAGTDAMNMTREQFQAHLASLGG